MSLEQRLLTAKDAVLETGALIRDIQASGNLDVQFKADKSPVTRADKEAEQMLRERILGAFPDDSFIGEEFPATQGTSEYSWVCDPVDGTWVIINHEMTAAVSLALLKKDKDTTRAVGAIVYNPFTDELYIAGEGIPTKRNEDMLPLVTAAKLNKSVVNFQISRYKPADIAVLYDLWQCGEFGKVVSTGGSVAYSLAQVAQGSHGVFVGAAIKPANLWDIAAGEYLVRSVGGRVTDLNNNEISGAKETRVLVASANPELHAKILGLLNQKYFCR